MKFRLVDRILDWQPRQSIRGTKAVSFEEYELKWAFGEDPRLPESLVMESVFQLGNWLVVLSSDFTQMGLLVRTQKIHFLEPLRPGEVLLIEVLVRRYRDDGIVFDGRGLVGGQEIARGTGCVATPVELAEYYDPGNLRVLFSEIYRPDGEAVG